MRLIWRFLKRYWLSALLAPAMIMVGVVADLAQPTLMARIVDEGIMEGDMAAVLTAGLQMFAYALVGMASGILLSYHAAKASINTGADIREELFRKIQTFSYGNLDKLETGGLITRLTSDIGQIERVILLSMRIVIRAPLKVIGSLVMAIIIGRELSLILVVISPLIVITIALLIHLAHPYFVKVQGKMDRLNGRLQENLSGIRLVKAFLRESYEKEKFGVANDELVDSNIRANRIMVWMQPLMHIFMNAGVVAALWWGGALVKGGELPVGKMMAFINYLSQMLFMLILMSNVIIQISRARVSIDRVREVLDEEPMVPREDTPAAQDNPPADLKGVLRFENVSFRYPGEKSDDVLTNLNFSLGSGETLAVLGATGSGKTSLVNLIPRFYDISSGRITLDGRDIRDIPLKTLRGRIAVVPQTSLLFSGTVKRNILFGVDGGTDDQCAAAARDASIDGFIGSLPESYETDVNQRGVNFSGGQKQRISLARALVREPDILIMDDSTSAVDLKTESRIQEALENRSPKSTCLIVAQRISSVRKADKILILEEGRIAAQGTHEELWKNCELYREICLSQMDMEEVTA